MTSSKSEDVCESSMDNNVNKSDEVKQIPIGIKKFRMSKTCKKLHKRSTTLLQRIYFLNNTGTRYVSVAIYPDFNNEVFVEIGRINGSYVLLNKHVWGNIAVELDFNHDRKYFPIKIEEKSIRLNMSEVQKLIKLRTCVNRLVEKYDASFLAINFYSESVRSGADFIEPYGTPAGFDYENLYHELKSIHV